MNPANGHGFWLIFAFRVFDICIPLASRIYQSMIKNKDALPPSNNIIRDPARKRYRTELAAMPGFLNFKENILMGDISRKHCIAVHARRQRWHPESHSKNPESSVSLPDADKASGNETRKSAFAGVGRPVKVSLWLSSILNLPRRKAEKTTRKNAR